MMGPSSQGLGRRLSMLLSLDLVNFEWKIFPDGESYFRLLSKVDDSVVLVHSLTPPQDKRIVELFFLLKLLSDYRAKDIILVIPYLAYMRQDKRFLDGEIVSVEVLADLLKTYDIDRYVFVDVHSGEVLKFFGNRAMEVSAFPLIGDFLSKYHLINPIVIAPDAKAFKYAETVAKIIGAESDYIVKRRDRSSGAVESELKEFNVGGRDVILVDDIISTGGTMINAIKILKEHGANRVFACCTHGLFIGNAVINMFNAGVYDIISTDTIESYYSRVSVAPAIASAIKSIIK
ncbi:MAG: ribose-phosphate diphosphokinase [archaeon YNP-LCB-003-016]|jgi:ribose-phosphate pyrophosphokinase|uniref:ribose-phosphate diphosphokinase n=1 Tax=Candidatus Culexarchaeum yellowstonense TaxID=2928963 RepID=UPI0026EE2368|nr:ribose-phosphate diphosphokinase [Candidatus Culexarchaeum yellowstonense]MCR6691615.1 ribose-phosphate diphosphokinase [Candidatus Culexarchaeum yellowstonense]